MLAFNEAISKVGLVEIPLKWCKYTWTNKQQDPLLERLDWFFYSNAWVTSLPNTWAYGLSRDTSDQTPCLISAATNVPKSNVFRFENFWLEHHQFPDVLRHGWSLPIPQSDKEKRSVQNLKTWEEFSRLGKVSFLTSPKQFRIVKTLFFSWMFLRNTVTSYWKNGTSETWSPSNSKTFSTYKKITGNREEPLNG
jgi:hypothetical protein